MEIKHDALWPLVYTRLRKFIGQGWDIDLVATVTRSTPDTVATWLTGNEPFGERLIKLWHLLAAVGCDSPELRKLPDFNRYCGELLTFNVLTMSELQQICRVRNPQPVLNMLRGTSPMHLTMDYGTLVSHYDVLLGQNRQQLLGSKRSFGTDEAAAKSPPQEPASTAKVVSALSSNTNLALQAATLLGAAGPLAEFLESDDSTAQERSKFRELMGEENLFRLANTLNRLCSERARTIGRKNR